MATHRPRVFDLRYHIASLAAVFLALAVGIVVGIAIADPIDEAESSLSQRRIEELQEELEQVQQAADVEAVEQTAIRDLLLTAYPTIMAGRLEGRRIAVLFLGDIAGDVRSAIERTLDDAGAGRPVRIVALALPFDPEELRELLASTPELSAFAAEGGLDDLGHTIGGEVTTGGDAPVLSALSGQLVLERSGDFTEAADGVVVVRSWFPDSDEGGPPFATTDDLIEGVLRGLDAADMPSVGVERTDAEQSSVGLYRDGGLSSVDDVDTLAGRVALAVVLAGGRRGHYGLKETAEAVVPPIPTQ